MRIRMLSDQRGADDGFTLRPYLAGVVYEFHTPRGVDLAEAFVREGWAEKAVKDPAPTAPPPPPVAPVSAAELADPQALIVSEAPAPEVVKVPKAKAAPKGK